jgi:hypothetical protein
MKLLTFYKLRSSFAQSVPTCHDELLHSESTRLRGIQYRHSCCMKELTFSDFVANISLPSIRFPTLPLRCCPMVAGQEFRPVSRSRGAQHRPHQTADTVQGERKTSSEIGAFLLKRRQLCQPANSQQSGPAK